ncbi:MAG: hypothetical protein Q8L24_00705 [bacterium]|nr:hypothetical protein [bacterium]
MCDLSDALMTIEIVREYLREGRSVQEITAMLPPGHADSVIPAAQEWIRNANPKDDRHGHPCWCPTRCPGASNCLCLCHG